MKYNYPYLNDSAFLKEISSLQIITYYTKIITLDWKENPIQNIQGKVISASFNIDGQSRVRRTGNISLIAQNFNGISNINSLFSINKKISIEIGYKNTTKKYQNFPIIWFPMGIYIIRNSSVTRSLSDLTISLQLSDKMCLLNGECGGVIPAATVFDTYYTIDENGAEVLSRPTIYQIIQQLVHHFGQQQLGKIIISDLSSRVKQVMKWNASFPLYIAKKNNQYRITVDSQQEQQLERQGWTISIFENGFDVGYIYTDFTFPGDLICDGGDTITAVLDKIIEVLGNFEYFYNINGDFVFQEIKNYLNNSQTEDILEYLNSGLQINTENYLLDQSNGKSVFQFQDAKLITSYNNTPQYNFIKNDFTVWGVKKINDLQLPIRYHLVIDKKPKIGNTYSAFRCEDQETGLMQWHTPIKYTNRNNFPAKGQYNVFYYDTENDKIYKWDKEEGTGIYTYLEIPSTMEQVTTKDWRTELYFQGVVAEALGIESNYYYAELLNEWPKLYNIEPDIWDENSNSYINNSDFKYNVLNSIYEIDYFLDFIDSNSKIMQFSIDNIGRRPYVLNQNSVNCVFEPNIPDIILIKIKQDEEIDYDMQELREECNRRGQAYYQIKEEIYNNLQIGGSFNSAYDSIRQLLHQYTSYNESISISCLPLYFLDSNTRISVTDLESDIYGDYMISSINFSINTNDSSMSINATKALEKI